MNHNSQIKESINNFKSLSLEGFYTIPKINWWLLKYYGLYKYCKENRNNGSCFEELPCLYTLNSEENKFQDFFQALDAISQLHKTNIRCREEIYKFQEFKNKRKLLNEWLEKNEEIFNNLFVEFWIDNEIIDNQIFLYLPYYKDLKIKIRTSEFRDVLHFLDLYSQVESN